MTTEQDRAPPSAGNSRASTPGGAVFLSYASDDATAAERIATALRAGGIEVWFDKTELRGGDAWDQSIRKQIKACALFIPVISRNAHARGEGYFRLEWKLAVDRSYLMASGLPFLVPVVIDDTPGADDRIPERFREIQWTRLAGGETPATFVDRVRRLLSPESAATTGPARFVGSVATHAAAGPGFFGRRTTLVYAAIAAVMLLALGYFGVKRLHESGVSIPDAASIAVLPMANESGEASQQYFSDGISEDLITALGQFPGLKVIGRTSSFQFRDSKEDSHTIGAKLGVAHLLEGSVRKAGETIRVSAELIDTADGTMQWSERYDRPYKDLFALQDEISGAVAGALRAKLLPSTHAAEQSERPPGGNLEAYNALMQGRFYGSRGTEPDTRKAIEFYVQATQLDPSYALAWSELSEAWSGFGQEFLGGPPREDAYAKARGAADRAVALSPNLAAAHVARGFLLQIADLDWHGAEAEFRRALTLAPNDANAKFSVGTGLASFGELEPAIEITRQALATEPLRAEWYYWLSAYYSGLNRLNEAERAIRRAIELQPVAAVWHWQLTVVQIQRGDARAALDAAQQEVSGDWQEIALALARQIGRDRAAADAALRTLIEKHPKDNAYEIAEVYALRNDAAGTFAWLDRAFSNREPEIASLLSDPFLLRYKDDQRFGAFCRKVGLPTPEQVGRPT